MSSTSPAGTEFELKYRAGVRAAADRLLAATSIGPFEARGNVRPAQHEDVYVDTADGALDRAGYAVRLRRAGGRTVVGLKSRAQGGNGAMHAREEIEGPAGGGLDPHAWPASAARSLVLELAGDAPLLELVTVRQLRRRRNLVDGDATVELSVDDVDIVSRGRVVDRFVEVELELIAGSPSALAPLAEALEAEEGLVPTSGSKLEAALSIAAAAEGLDDVDSMDAIEAIDLPPDEPGDTLEELDVEDVAAIVQPVEVVVVAEPMVVPPPIKPVKRGHGQPGVSADDTVAEAGRKVLRLHFERMLAREEGTRSGVDPEDLHAMRVATRRMRAAWRIFGDAYRPGTTRRFPREMREVGRRLGAVRDLDVLTEGLDAYIAEHPADGQHLAVLGAAWRSRREQTRIVLLKELDAARYARFVEEFDAFTSTEGFAVRPVAPTVPHRVRDTAPTRIWATHGDVRAYESVLRWADIPTLHELRIAGKWLRYSLEFVREALGPEADALIARVVGLQDHLGLMNDAYVSADLARAFLVDRGANLSTEENGAIGRYLVDREREASRLRRSAGRPFRIVTGPPFRRTLARIVAKL